MDPESQAQKNDSSLDIEPHQLGSHSFSYFHLNLFLATNYTI